MHESASFCLRLLSLSPFVLVRVVFYTARALRQRALHLSGLALMPLFPLATGRAPDRAVHLGLQGHGQHLRWRRALELWTFLATSGRTGGLWDHHLLPLRKDLGASQSLYTLLYYPNIHSYRRHLFK